MDRADNPDPARVKVEFEDGYRDRRLYARPPATRRVGWSISPLVARSSMLAKIEYRNLGNFREVSDVDGGAFAGWRVASRGYFHLIPLSEGKRQEN